MKDLELWLADRPGSLAELGAALGAAGVSVEGGGVFVHGGVGVAHFLVSDAAPAERALRAAGIDVVAARDVLMLRLRQEVPGQLGSVCAALAAAGVNITTQYSDHDNQLILVVDDGPRAAAARDTWLREQAAHSPR